MDGGIGDGEGLKEGGEMTKKKDGGGRETEKGGEREEKT